MQPHIWSKEECQFLIDNVKGISLRELTERYNKKFNMNLSENTIATRKNLLGIKSGFNLAHFKKGQTPHNKGKKMSPYVYKKVNPTMYKKGNVPPNRRPIGSERIDKNGYIEIKVQDGSLNKNWMGKHRYIYEKVHGKIPKGHKVIFADGNNRNFDEDNLILISNSEQLTMNRYGLYKKDKELTKSGVAIAKVIDKVNKRKKQ